MSHSEILFLVVSIIITLILLGLFHLCKKLFGKGRGLILASFVMIAFFIVFFNVVSITLSPTGLIPMRLYKESIKKDGLNFSQYFLKTHGLMKKGQKSVVVGEAYNGSLVIFTQVSQLNTLKFMEKVRVAIKQLEK